MSSSVATVLGIISSIAVIVFLYVKVLPQKYNGKLENKYLQWMHNYFNFKKLYLEDILKFIFVVGTVFFVCVGFFMMFSVTETYFGDQSNFVAGLSVLIFGPITMRFIFELQMMGILLVRNVMEINKKMKKTSPEDDSDFVFDTGKIVGGINFCKWYRGECKNEKFYKSPSSRIVEDYLKSVSDSCIELWLDSKKKSYATIIYINDIYAMSLHGDDSKEVFSTKCKAGETVTFGSKEKNDPNVTKLFNRLSSRLDFLNKKYEQNRASIKK